jgi:hypothetical protein
MAQDMGPATRRPDLCPIERVSDKRVDTAALAKRHGRAAVPHEDLTRVSPRPASSQVGRQRPGDRRGERKHERASRLGPPHTKDTGSPIDIIDPQLDDLTRAEAIDGQDQKHRIVTSSDRRPPIDAPQQLPHLGEADGRRNGREPVPSWTLDTARPVVRQPTGAMEVAQQTAYHLNQLGLRASADPADQRAEELIDERDRQLPDIFVGEMLRKVLQKLTTPPPMGIEGRLSKTTMPLKEREVLVEQRGACLSIRRHDASFPAHHGQCQRLKQGAVM